MNNQKLFEDIAVELAKIENIGKVASYIPELNNVNPNKFGFYLLSLDKQNYGLGDFNEKFSIQSISKTLALTLAFKLEGDNLWKRVGVEPSGTPFNSLFQLEHEKGIPRNPLINAGALVICDILISRLKVNPKQEFIDFVREISGIPTLGYNARVSESEKSTSFRNATLVNLMKSYGNIKNDIDVVLDFYCNLCSIEMTCKELAQTFLFLAGNGVHTLTKVEVVSSSQSKRINSIMQLSGFYDEAGEFTFKVGLPGKSGVGGGIIAIHPGKYTVAVWSPRLNKKGNSYRGMKILEFLTTKTQSSIF